MKTQLTKEQSKHLIELGIDEDKATYFDNVYDWSINDYPRYFTLTDILEILPKEIEGRYVNHSLCMNYGCDIPESEHNLWFAYYDDLNDLEPKHAEELIDSLYELCVYTIENGYLKF